MTLAAPAGAGIVSSGLVNPDPAGGTVIGGLAIGNSGLGNVTVSGGSQIGVHQRKRNRLDVGSKCHVRPLPRILAVCQSP